ncbi:hypothetical protein, partial [Nocardia rhamnosiphila]|uniref:hypothetical protein n=1 Tax=Nocardia rhamnosiphila TaxID=426716 RepID=UPI000A5EB531
MTVSVRSAMLDWLESALEKDNAVRVLVGCVRRSMWAWLRFRTYQRLASTRWRGPAAGFMGSRVLLFGSRRGSEIGGC